MSTVLRKGVAESDRWQRLADDAPWPNHGHYLVSLARWSQGAAPAGVTVGLQLANTVNVDELWPQIQNAAVIELEFPKVGDGRAYSQARILRGRLGFAGELRAAGEGVVRDHVYFLQRCGFDALLLRADQDPAGCTIAMHDFTHPYQPAADGLPGILERRRAIREMTKG